jgi:hypothetical protein
VFSFFFSSSLPPSPLLSLIISPLPPQGLVLSSQRDTPSFSTSDPNPSQAQLAIAGVGVTDSWKATFHNAKV